MKLDTLGGSENEESHWISGGASKQMHRTKNINGIKLYDRHSCSSLLALVGWRLVNAMLRMALLASSLAEFVKG